MHYWEISNPPHEIALEFGSQLVPSLKVGLIAPDLDGKLAESSLKDFVTNYSSIALTAGCHCFFDYELRFIGYWLWATTCPGRTSEHTLESRDSELEVLAIGSFPGLLPQVLAAARLEMLKRVPPIRRVKFTRQRRARMVMPRSIALKSKFSVRPVAPEIPEKWGAGTIEKLKSRIRRAEALGNALMALSRHTLYGSTPLQSVLRTIISATSLLQSKTYFDNQMRPAGFISWAWLSDFTIDRLATHPVNSLRLSEWNEGEILCFIHISAMADVAEEVAKDVGGRIFPNETKVLLNVAGGRSEKSELLNISKEERPELISWLITQFTKSTAQHAGGQS